MKLTDFKYYMYPNPRARRENYTLLDGEWDFEFLDGYELPIRYSKKIIVPFTYETEASGVDDKTMHEFIAYKKVIYIDELSNYLLHFEGVDYKCKIYVNKRFVYEHTGCYVNFSFDIKDFIQLGENVIEVLVYDSFSKCQLRGKQRTRSENYECWYTQYTGIYDHVYLEKVEDTYIVDALFNGDDKGLLNYKITLNNKADIKIDFKQDDNAINSVILKGKKEYIGTLQFDKFKQYSFNQPNLCDVEIHVIDKNDTYSTYFGFRTIESKGSNIYLNNEKIYLKMILNQGYYGSQGITSRDENILTDILNIKNIGFNGMRIHQKQETNLLYYISDVLGVYIWSEIPSAYEYGIATKEELYRLTEKIINKNYNSPSIITYVLFNESWGIPSIKTDLECQDFVKKLGQKAKIIDPSRLIILNDGWHQINGTEILSLHEYEQSYKEFLKEYKNKDYVVRDKIINKYGKAFADTNYYEGQPIIISEFGGAALEESVGWGYGDKISNIEEYKKQLINIFDTIKKINYLSGYCYTQLTDVEQETNGLFYENRIPKLPLNELKKIIEG